MLSKHDIYQNDYNTHIDRVTVNVAQQEDRQSNSKGRPAGISTE